MSISIIIPNYNGKSLFERVLPVNMPLFKANGISEIIIVDDASTDESVSFLKQKYPEIKLVENPKNLGFSKSANRGVAAATSDIIFLLNSDMIIHELNIDTITTQLSDPHIFALTPHVYRTDDPDNNEAITVGYFKGGWLHTENAGHWGSPEDLKDTKTFDLKDNMPLLWCCGGAIIGLKEKWKTLNGLDEVFSPFYFEDVDLSYRAWKQGWKCLYTTHCKIEHFHQSSISNAHKQKKINRIHLRNEYIFMWKNLSDPSYCLSHLLTITIRCLTLQFTHMQAMLGAIIRLTPIIKYRLNSPKPKITDKKILSQFQDITTKRFQ